MKANTTAVLLACLLSSAAAAPTIHAPSVELKQGTEVDAEIFARILSGLAKRQLFGNLSNDELNRVVQITAARTPAGLTRRQLSGNLSNQQFNRIAKLISDNGHLNRRHLDSSLDTIIGILHGVDDAGLAGGATDAADAPSGDSGKEEPRFTILPYFPPAVDHGPGSKVPHVAADTFVHGDLLSILGGSGQGIKTHGLQSFLVEVALRGLLAGPPGGPGDSAGGSTGDLNLGGRPHADKVGAKGHGFGDPPRPPTDNPAAGLNFDAVNSGSTGIRGGDLDLGSPAGVPAASRGDKTFPTGHAIGGRPGDLLDNHGGGLRLGDLIAILSFLGGQGASAPGSNINPGALTGGPDLGELAGKIGNGDLDLKNIPGGLGFGSLLGKAGGIHDLFLKELLGGLGSGSPAGKPVHGGLGLQDLPDGANPGSLSEEVGNDAFDLQVFLGSLDLGTLKQIASVLLGGEGVHSGPAVDLDLGGLTGDVTGGPNGGPADDAQAATPGDFNLDALLAALGQAKEGNVDLDSHLGDHTGAEDDDNWGGNDPGSPAPGDLGDIVDGTLDDDAAEDLGGLLDDLAGDSSGSGVTGGDAEVINNGTATGAADGPKDVDEASGASSSTSSFSISLTPIASSTSSSPSWSPSSSSTGPSPTGSSSPESSGVAGSGDEEDSGSGASGSSGSGSEAFGSGSSGSAGFGSSGDAGLGAGSLNSGPELDSGSNSSSSKASKSSSPTPNSSPSNDSEGEDGNGDGSSYSYSYSYSYPAPTSSPDN